jgi:thiosulfate/3-mercaptopyruvate sulfurtransferase
MNLVFLVLTMPVSFMTLTSDQYPRSDLLLEPSELGKPEVAKSFLILDVRGQGAYDVGHIPGAVMISAAKWAKEFRDGKDVEGWSKRLGNLGITSETKVVVYDDTSTKDASRTWWILKFFGVKDVKLLNGMWTGWKAGSYPISQERNIPKPVTFHAQVERIRLANKEDVLQSVESKDSQIIDARSASEHSGKNKLAQKSGCIPGSTNLDWVNLVDPQTQRFKNPAELKKLFDENGIDLNKPLTPH